jgi:adenylate cyclase
MTVLKSILMVDRNAAAGTYVRDMLQYYGYGVTNAPSWEEASRLLQQEEFDLILFDEGMIHRGLGTPLNELREAGYQQPVVIMSDIALNEMWNSCMPYGPVELINKPVSPSTLKIIVEAAMKRVRPARIIPVIRVGRPQTASAAMQAS